jgi:hypothetical protein
VEALHWFEDGLGAHVPERYLELAAEVAQDLFEEIAVVRLRARRRRPVT